MSDKKPTSPVQLPDATGAPGTTEEPQHTAHEAATSHAAVLLNARMQLAAKPNTGEPLSHRNRSKAGRKG
jgi:hypothetical protein